MKKKLIAFIVFTLSVLFVIVGIERFTGNKELSNFDKNSFILLDVDKEDVEEIANHYDATFYNNEESGTSVIYLKEGVTVDKVFNDKFFKQYKESASKNYYATFFDASDDHYSTPTTTLDTEQFLQQEYLNYINLGDVASKTSYYRKRVAIIDTGVDLSHPDLKNINISRDSYNVKEEKKVYQDGVLDYSWVHDSDGHGTNIAGIIAGSGNILGINSEVELIVVKISPKKKNGKLEISSDQLIQALDYVGTLNDVSVLNMSWGYYNSTNLFKQQIEKLVNKGTVCVASAGNDKTSSLSYPAADDNVIAVGAYDYETNQLADYSNYGNSVDLVAPGKVFTTDLNGKYNVFNGTSYAAAIVTGVLSHADLYGNDYSLSSSCVDLGDRGKDFYYGNGLLDASALVNSKKSFITFDSLCEEVGKIVYRYADGGVLQEFPEPERVYDFFDGWYYDINLTKEVNYYYDSFTGDITLYAKWVSNSFSGNTLFTYKEVEKNEIEITGYTGKRFKITIPEIIDGKTVVGIGASAFSESPIKSISLPSTLRYIGDFAFDRCSKLEDINIPDSVKLIGRSAFIDCGHLTNIDITENSKLEEIQTRAFYNTSLNNFYVPSKVFEIGTLALASNSIKEITVHKNNLSYSSNDGVLYNKVQNKLVFYPSLKIGSFAVPTTVKTIASYAFYRCDLENVDLNKIETIESDSFSFADIDYIKIPSSVTSFNDYAFVNSFLGTIIISEGIIRIPEFAFENATISYIKLPKSLEVIEGGAFSSAKIEEFLLPQDGNLKSILTTIRDLYIYGAFKSSTITSFVAPESLEYIGLHCFMYCNSLTNVDLSKTQLQKLLASTFESSALESISLPETLTCIEDNCFSHANLSSLHIGENVVEIGEGFVVGNNIIDFTVDENNPNFTTFDSILYSKDLTKIHSCVSDISYVSILSSIDTIQHYAFKERQSITTVDFESGSSLTYIGREAFYGVSIRSIHFIDSISYIGIEAFSRCKNLTYVTFGDNIQLEAINGGTFYNCNISDIDIPLSVKSISGSAFVGNKISSLNIPGNVQFIGYRAFAENKISVLNLNEGLKTIDIEAFSNNNISSLHIPASVELIKEFAFYSVGTNISALSFAEGSNLTTIETLAFGSLSIKELKVPSSVSFIGTAVFNGVDKLIFAENSQLERLDVYSIGGFLNIPGYVHFDSHGVKELYFLENSSLKEIVGTLNENKDILVLDLENTQLEKIGELAFSNCKNLHTITLPNTIKEIESYAFLNCEKLKTIVIPSSIERIENFAFFDCSISVYFESSGLPIDLSTNWDLGVNEYFLGVSNIYTEGDYSFIDSDSGKTLIKYNGTSTVVDLSTFDIDYIGSESFIDTNVTKVILPSSLKGLNKSAFANTKLQEIHIPENVKYIDSYAFYKSDIKKITFAENSSLLKISKYAFANTENLKSISLPSSVSVIDSYAFYHSNIESIDFNNNTSLTEISDYAFAYSKLKTINIPENITNIGIGAFLDSSINYVNFNSKDIVVSERAFYMADLLEVYIPDNVVYIGEYAFSGNVNLVKFVVDENNKYYSSYEGSLLNKNKTVLICVPATITGEYNVLITVEDIAKGAFEYSNITSVNFANNNALYIINTRAFFNAKKLERVVIPNSVVYIDYYAFAYCDNLKEVVFEEGTKLHGIYEGAFYYCKSLEYINIPETVTEISDYAFYATTSLETFDFTNIEEINDYAFAYSGIQEFIVTGENLMVLCEDAFSNSSLKVIKIDDSLEHYINIEHGPFRNLNQLEELEIFFYEDYPISYYFGGTNYYDNEEYVPSSLRKLTINEPIKSLPNYAFYRLSMLEYIDLPDECYIITTGSFVGVKAYVELPENVVFEGEFSISTGSVIEKLTFDDRFANQEIYLGGLTGIKELYFECENLKLYGISSDYVEVIYFSSPNYLSIIGNVEAKNATIIFDFYLPDYINEGNIYDLYHTMYMGNKYMYLDNGVYKHLDSVYYNDSFERIVQVSGNFENIYISSTVKNFVILFCTYKNVYYDGTLQQWLAINFEAYWDNPMLNAEKFYYKDENNKWTLLDKLVLPDGCTSIGQYQFAGISATSIDLNDVETIGNSAFIYAKEIDEITISEKVNNIEDEAFAYISSIDNLNIYCNDNFELYKLFKNTNINNFILAGGKVSNSTFERFINFKTFSLSPLVTEVDYFGSLEIETFNYLGTIEQWLQINFTSDCFTYASDKVLINGKEVKEIVIPESITSIGQYQFANFKKLEKVVMHDGVTNIGDYAFTNCSSLNEVIFSKELKSIGNNAFSRCEKLTSIILKDKVSTIGDYAFETCVNLVEVKLSQELTSLGSYVFLGCDSLRELVIPENVTSIGFGIFGSSAKIEKLTLPFVDSNLINLYTYFDSDYGISYLKELTITNDTDIPSDTFNNSNSIEKVVVTNKITNFNGAFDYSNNIKCIEYLGTIYELVACSGFNPSSKTEVKTIDSTNEFVVDESTPNVGVIFNNNSTIEKLTILTNNVSLNNSFVKCSNLKSLVLLNYDIIVPDHIKNQVEEIEVLNGKTVPSEYFSSYHYVKKITLANETSEIGSRAFVGLRKLEEVIVPNNLQIIGDYAFASCNLLEKIKLPDTVKYIGDSAFYECHLLSEVNLTDSVDYLGNNAFAFCSSLKEVYVPNASYIGSSVFRDCTSLEKVSLNKNIKNINEYMFDKCSSLSEVTLSNVETIYSYAFGHCESLKEITLPSSVTYIYRNAFAGANIEKLVFEEGFTFVDKTYEYGESFLDALNNLKIVEVPKSLSKTNIYLANIDFIYFNGTLKEFNDSTCNYTNIKHLYLNGELVKELVFPEGVDVIKWYYSSLVDLQTVIIPSSVTSVSTNAFADCYALHTIYNYTDNDEISKLIRYSYSGKIVYSNGAIYGESYEVNIDGLIFSYKSSKDTLPRLIRYEGDLSSIVLPDTVNGDNYIIYRFNNGSLTDLTIPSEVRTNQDSFVGSTLKKIVINDYKIYVNCFEPLKNSLEEITFVNFQQGTYSFNGFTKLKKISYVDCDDVTSIPQGSISNCPALEIVELPSTLQSIENLFDNCTSLKSIDIPSGVVSIDSSFSGCTSLERISLPEGLEDFRGLSNCPSLIEINLPNSLVTLGNITNCPSLESLTIPGNVTSIGLFTNCSSLKEVIILDGVSDALIKRGAFDGCSSLEKLVVPSTYRAQTDYYYSDPLFDLYFNGDVYDWCQMEFENRSNSLAYLANNIYFKNDKGEWYLVEDLIIPSDVSVVHSYAFVFFKNIKSISFTSSTYIEKEAFCTYLYGKENPIIENIYYSGSSDYFVGLASENFDYDMSKNIKGIYVNGELLTKLIIPEGTTSVENGFFTNLSFVNYLYIPESLTYVKSNYLFIPNLTKVNYGGTVEKWAQINFESYINNPTSVSGNLYINGILLEELSLDFGLYGVDNFNYVMSIKTISYMGNITEIPSGFMYGNKSLETVYIPDSVISIATYAFFNCDNLKNVFIGKDSQLELIENCAFASCEKIDNFYIPVSLKEFQLSPYYYRDEIVNIGKVYYHGTPLQWIKIDFGSNLRTSFKFEELYFNNKILETMEFDESIDESSTSNKLNQLTTIKNVVFPKVMNNWQTFGIYQNVERIYYKGTLSDWLASPYNGLLLKDEIEFYYLDENNNYVKLSKHLVIPSSITTISKNYPFGTKSFETVTFSSNLSWSATSGKIGSNAQEVYFNGTLEEFINSTVTPKIDTEQDCELYINGKRTSKIFIEDNTNLSNLKYLRDYDIFMLVNNTDLLITVDDAYDYGLRNVKLICDKNGIMYNSNTYGDYQVLEDDGDHYYFSKDWQGYHLFYIDTNKDVITLPATAFGQSYQISSLNNNKFEKIIIPEGFIFTSYFTLPATTLEFDKDIRVIDNFVLTNENCILPDKIDLLRNITAYNPKIFDELLRKSAVIENCFNSDHTIENITIYSNIKRIENSFGSCVNIKNIVIEEGIESIISSFSCNSMPEYSYKLTNLHFPSTLVELQSSFNGPTFLESITFAEGQKVKDLYGNFSNLLSLKHVEIPEGIETISYYSFNNCASLTYVSFPSTLKSIEYGSFNDCTSLATLEFNSKTCSVNYDTFINCDSISEINAKGDYDWGIDFSNTVLAKNINNYENGCIYIANSLVYIHPQTSYVRIKETTKYSLTCDTSHIEFVEYDYLDGDDRHSYFNFAKTIRINNMEREYGFNTFLNNNNLENVIISDEISYLFNRLSTDRQTFYFELDKQVVDLWGLHFKNAYYKGEWITVTFEDHQGLVVSKIPQSKYQIIRIPYYVPTSDNYTNRYLNGWDYDSDGVTDPVPATSPEDVTFKAVVDSKQAIYYVTYFDKDGVTPLFVDEYTYGETLQIREPISKKGHTFNEWSYTLTDNIITGDLSIYSTWTHIGEHDYSIVEVVESTCSERGYTKHICTICDEYYVDKFEERLEHEYNITNIEATCDEQGYTLHQCINCEHSYKDSYIEKLSHSYLPYEVVDEVSCDENGRQKHECELCGYVEFEVIPMLGHDLNEHVANEATCSHRGQVFYSCNRCEYNEEHLINYLDHNYVEIVIPDIFVNELKENNIVVYEYLDHYSSFVCIDCAKFQSKTVKLDGFYLQSTCTHSETYESIIVEATCASDGLIKHVCLQCNEAASYEKVEKGACINDYHIIHPTCEDIGYTIVQCSVCHTINGYIDHVSALGHNYIANYEWINNECVITLTCSHDSSHIIIDNMLIQSNVSLAPTCEETGVLTYTATYVLDGKTYTISKNEIIDALGHNVIVDEKVESTCTSTGLTEGSHCDRCNEVFVKQELIEMKPHEYISNTITATCENQGYVEHICHCGDNYIDNIVAALGHSYVLNSSWQGEEFVVSVICQHDDSHVILVDVNVDKQIISTPSCEIDGQMILTATYTYEGTTYTSVKEVITEKTGHNYVASFVNTDLEYTITLTCSHDSSHIIVDNAVVTSTVTLQPTCEETGILTITASYTHNGVVYETSDERIIDALTHNIVICERVEPTCSSFGYTEGTYCDRCNKVFTGQQFIEKLPHQHAHIVVEATCTSNGYDLYMCDCGDFYFENIIEALGHDEVTVEGLEPTCTSEGYTKSVYCDRCREVIIQSQQLPRLEHEVVRTYYPPTCEERGYELISCKVCQNQLGISYKEFPTGHDYEASFSWNEDECDVTLTCKNDATHVIVGEAEVSCKTISKETCSGVGIIQYLAVYEYDGVKYSNVKTIVIPALDHTLEIIPKVEPTCSKNGTTEGTRCSVCGKIVTSPEFIPKTEHHYHSEVVEPTCTTKGYTIYICDDCNFSKFENYTDMIDHVRSEWIVDKEPTVDEEGHKYVKCIECGEIIEAAIIEKLTPPAKEKSYVAPIVIGSTVGAGSLLAAILFIFKKKKIA